MKHTRAKELMDRYFAGQTSLREEQALRDYFTQERVAGELTEYRALFTYWSSQAEVTAPVRKAERRQLPRWIMAVAAGLLLLLVARLALRSQRPALTGFPVAERQEIDWSRYEITDEKQALQFVRTVLSNTSDRFQSGPRITIRELRGVEEILD